MEVVTDFPYNGGKVNIKVVTTSGTFMETTSTESSVSTSNPQSNIPPISAFTSQANYLEVQFTDASADSDGSIASWLWDFGDGSTSTTQNPTHHYSVAGTYAVSLKVTDNDSGSDDDSQNVVVSAANVNPVAAFTFDPSSPTTANTVTFTDTSSDTDGTIVSRLWTFDDGTTSTAQNPTHQFATAGTYTVRLTVTDDDAATNYVEHDVVVSAYTPTRQTIFSDDFESDFNTAYWVSTNVASRTYADSTRGNVANIRVSSGGTQGSMTLQVDTTGYSSIELDYQRSFSASSNHDYFIVEWRVGTSGSWTTIENQAGQSSWTNKYDIALNGANGIIQVRFRLSNCEYDDYWWSYTGDQAYINNVAVTGIA